jgi:hypothetical protein
LSAGAEDNSSPASNDIISDALKIFMASSSVLNKLRVGSTAHQSCATARTHCSAHPMPMLD